MKFPEKYTIEKLKEHLQTIHPEIELISDNYIDNDSIIKVRCKQVPNNCTHQVHFQFNASYNSILQSPVHFLHSGELSFWVHQSP